MYNKNVKGKNMVDYIIVKSQSRKKLWGLVKDEINKKGIGEQVINIVLSENGKFAGDGLLERRQAVIYYIVK